MSRHTDSAAVTLRAAGMAWTGALCVCALRCDGCGAVLSVGPRDTPERAEAVTRNRARYAGWRLAQTTESDLCAACVEREARP